MTTVSSLLQQMSGTAFTGRALGEAVDVMEKMICDASCRVVLTLSGAMTMAGLGGLIRESIKRNWVQCIIATGALVGHGLVENLGMPHYKANPSISDEEYLKLRLNRVYDTLEPEQNLNDLWLLLRDVFDDWLSKQNQPPIGTADLLRMIGLALPGDGILQDAARHKIPVIIPAFTDSELGLDVSVYNVYAQTHGKPQLHYDAFRDLSIFSEFCQETIDQGKLGIFTIGGGVPRNWAQQIGPYVDLRNVRLNANLKEVRYTYGVRICPDPVHYGHLSGCTYSEGVSWGKFVPRAEGGRYAEVLLDATVGWPLLVSALIERGL